MKPSIFKTKSVIAMALVVFMLVPMLFAVGGVKAAGNATVDLVPSTPINLTYPSTLPVGSTFTVQVKSSKCSESVGCKLWYDMESSNS